MTRFGETTIRPAGTLQGEEPGRIVLLTLISHPDFRRVGERAVLWPLSASPTLQLGRSTPEFSRPGEVWEGRALEDPYLSRRPWSMSRHADGVLLSRQGTSTELVVDGESVGHSVLLPHKSIDRGVALELAGRITLLLHTVSSASLEESRADSPIVGAGEALTDVLAAIGRVADLSVPILLRGESGTGKELAARELHRRSRRRRRPFVAVNLGALPTSLAASELFGHVKGAFTGAAGAREGYFSAADRGTLFLDEIGEAPPEVQAMLLRTLETGEVVPVGSHVAKKVDVRVIAATDSDLESRASRGDFKEPLLHRLSAYVIRLPALRDRRDDIGRLVLHFAGQALDELGDGSRLDRFEPEGEPWMEASVASRLTRHSWPGNVRQLRNVVRQLVIDSRGQELLRPGRRLDELLGSGFLHPGSRADPSSTDDASESTHATLESDKPTVKGRRPSEVTDSEVEQAMSDAAFEPAAAARRLGISRASIYNLIRRHPTLRVAEDVPEKELEAALEAAEHDVPEAAGRLGVSVRALARRMSSRHRE